MKDKIKYFFERFWMYIMVIFGVIFYLITKDTVKIKGAKSDQKVLDIKEKIEENEISIKDKVKEAIALSEKANASHKEAVEILEKTNPKINEADKEEVNDFLEYTRNDH